MSRNTSHSTLKADRDWMNQRLAGSALTEFDRLNAKAMVARGVLIGNLLIGVWRKFKAVKAA